MSIYLIVDGLRYWLPLAAVFWLFGYFATRLGADNQYLRVSVWFFYLCGAPKNVGFENGLLTRMGVGFQIIAFFQIIFAIFFSFLFEDTDLSKLVGIFSSLIFSLLITNILVYRASKN